MAKRKPKDPGWIRAIKKVNIFLRRLRRQEVLTFMVFLLISSFFWVIETASEESDSSYMVEFRVDNLPANIVFTTQVPQQLKVSVKDKNINLLNYSYSKTFDTLSVDFSRYNDALGNFRISGAELQALMLNELFPSTTITSLTPSLIDAKFAITGGKMLPVAFDADISPAANYRFHPISITPDSVLVHAPSAILDTLTMVRTKYYEAIGLTDSLNLKLPLQLDLGVKASPEQVCVQIPIARFVEKTFQNVEVSTIDVPADAVLSIFPNRVNVSCLVDFSYYNDISADDFYLTVSFNSVKSGDQKYLPIEIISYANPDVVSNIRLHTGQVEYIIEQH